MTLKITTAILENDNISDSTRLREKVSGFSKFGGFGFAHVYVETILGFHCLNKINKSGVIATRGSLATRANANQKDRGQTQTIRIRKITRRHKRKYFKVSPSDSGFTTFRIRDVSRIFFSHRIHVLRANNKTNPIPKRSGFVTYPVTFALMQTYVQVHCTLWHSSVLRKTIT